MYRLITSGTIEEKVYHRQIYKQFLTEKVCAAAPQQPPDMRAAQLKPASCAVFAKLLDTCVVLRSLTVVQTEETLGSQATEAIQCLPRHLRKSLCRVLWPELFRARAQVLRDPKQKRFFKSKDIHDLFTLGPQYAGASETASIFSSLYGGLEVPLDPDAVAVPADSAPPAQAGLPMCPYAVPLRPPWSWSCNGWATGTRCMLFQSTQCFIWCGCSHGCVW